MSVEYKPILWNRQKRIYDGVLALAVLLYLGLFIGLGAWIHPDATAETLLIRGLGTAAFLLLHIILLIGPLCRLDSRFLPLLYNRRHLGVTMFTLALAHGTFSLVQFHSFGNVNPLVSLFSQFGFQQLGFISLMILFLMAATSHDFWLHALTPRIWKSLHMGVYIAYVLLIAHVAFGALQSEPSPLLAGVLILGATAVIAIHILAGMKERKLDNQRASAREDGFVDICKSSAIPDTRAKVIALGNERVAVFRYGDNISAVSNVCRHQNGPLGEGKIIDGCITCPWHGYQYRPEDGCSPPPFTDKVPTYQVRVIGGTVLIHPRALPAGTRVEPARV